jgi:copper chaperone CopZ
MGGHRGQINFYRPVLANIAKSNFDQRVKPPLPLATIRLFCPPLLLACCALLCSCLKLQEKQVKVEVPCQECVQYLQDSVGAMPGVKLVRYSPDKKLLSVKYDTASFNTRRLQRFLVQQGFATAEQDSTKRLPVCCR